MKLSGGIKENKRSATQGFKLRTFRTRRQRLPLKPLPDQSNAIKYWKLNGQIRAETSPEGKKTFSRFFCRRGILRPFTFFTKKRSRHPEAASNEKKPRCLKAKRVNLIIDTEDPKKRYRPNWSWDQRTLSADRSHSSLISNCRAWACLKLLLNGVAFLSKSTDRPFWKLNYATLLTYLNQLRT